MNRRISIHRSTRRAMAQIVGLAMAALFLIGGASAMADKPLLSGDTNRDLVVDIDDLNNVRNNFGGAEMGDTDGNGVVDIDDLNNVRNNFGARIVPEPSSALLALFGTALAWVASRRRR